MQNILSYEPGEHELNLIGKAGNIEAILTIPQNTSTNFALLGHPHSLHGGSMNNKVITTIARAFKELNIPSLRFNFRGVGKSAGVYDNGIGESEDLVYLSKQLPANLQLILAGFSFGSYVTYRAATEIPTKLLISVAPPVHHYDYQEYQVLTNNWVIIQGDKDEIVPYSKVEEFISEATMPIKFINFANADHFFHGKLVELKAKIIEIMTNL